MTFPLPVRDENPSNIQVRLVVDGEGTFGIGNAEIVHGKFYPEAGSDHELTKERVDQKEFSHGEPTTVNACNESRSPVGTEGSFDIKRSGERVARVSWKIPGGDRVRPKGQIPVSVIEPIANVDRPRTHEHAYEIDVDGFEFRRESLLWELHTSGTITMKLFDISCMLKVHNDMPGREVFARITHQKDISQQYGGIRSPVPDTTVDLTILAGTTVDWLIGIADDKVGELHLQFGYVSFTGPVDLDYGTFKCDKLRFPSNTNAIGNPPERIDVTKTAHNDQDTRSEIHIHVR